MSVAVPKGHSVSDVDLADFIRLPGSYTIATLPTRPTTSNNPAVQGVLAYTTDGGYYAWNGTIWVALGGGAGPGPSNTPGFGSASITDAAPTTTLTNYSPAGLTSATSEIRMNATAATTLNSLVSTGRTNGSAARLVNYGTAVITIPHLGTGAAGNQFRCPSAASSFLANEAATLVVWDSASNAWRLD